MHRTIRLTGRKQLPKSAVRVTLTELGGRPLVTFAIAEPERFKDVPANARLSLVLDENKGLEVVELGTVAHPRASQVLATAFDAPKCRLRVADPGVKAKGLLLASTSKWTLKGEGAELGGGKGILSFLAADTAPQSWKLELNEDDYPLVKVDKRIPSVGQWVKDPMFLAIALPSVIARVFDAILREEHHRDRLWVADWLRWAELLLPGDPPPIAEDGERPAQAAWSDRLVDQFCRRGEFGDALLAALAPKEER